MKIDISYKALVPPVEEAEVGFFWKSEISGRTYWRVADAGIYKHVDVLIHDPKTEEWYEGKVGTLVPTTAVTEEEVLRSKLPPGTVITITV